MRSPTVDAQAHRDDALGGDADMHVGRLAGDREVADEALGDQQLAPALDLLLGFLVRDDAEPHPTPSCSRRSAVASSRQARAPFMS